uniref:Uncharacterized protein n=1 Tax=Strigamia maritima TaxID=126957 RepID=T1J8P5_STRMM
MYASRSRRPRPPYVISAGTHMNPRINTLWRQESKDLGNDEIVKENANLISWATAEISVPGLRQIQNPQYNKFGKLFWFLAISTAAVLCIHQVTHRCIHYSTSPISNNVMLSRDDFLDFPATTICTTHSALFNKEAKDKLTVHRFPENTSDQKVMEQRAEFWDKNMKAVGSNVPTLWNLMSISLDNTDVSDSCPDEKCFTKRYISTYKGDCVIVEAKEKVFHRGSLTGVNIVIRTNYPEIDKIDENLIKFEFIATKKKPCSTTKAVADCWRKCLEEGIIEKVAKTNCRIPPMPNVVAKKELQLCSNAADLNKTQFSVIRRFELRENMQCNDCPRRCKEVLFNILQDVVKPGKNGSTVLHIYIPDNTIDSLNEKYTYDFVTFLCELGGTLGLFLGFCSLTLIELVEVVFGFLLFQLRKGKQTSFRGKNKKVYPERIRNGNNFANGY